MCQRPADPLKTLEDRLAQLRAEAARLMKEIRKAEADVRNFVGRSKEPSAEADGRENR
jgi:hypothetical protein